MQTNRRSVLKAGGALAVLGTTGLAGCSGILGGNAQPSPADYRYDPSALVETKTKFFGFVDYAGLYEARDNFPESMQESFTSSEDSPIAPEDIDSMTGVGGARMAMSGSSPGSGSFFGSLGVLGSFEKSTVEGSITSEGEATRSGEYEGFTLYENAESASPGEFGERTDASATAAVNDGVMIVGFAASTGGEDVGVTGAQAARTMIDAGNGNAEGLAANSDRARALADRFDGSSVMIGGQVDPALIELLTSQSGDSMTTQFVAGLRAGGFGMTVDGETTTMNLVALYTDETAAEESGVKELVELVSGQAVENNPGLDSIDAEYDGTAAVVTIAGETETIFEQGSAASPGGALSVADPADVARPVPEP